MALIPNMSTENLLLIALAAVMAFWALGAHNRMVRLSNAVAAQYPPVDAQLIERARWWEQRLALMERLPAERQLPLAQALQAQRAAMDALRQRPSSASNLSRLIQACAEGERAVVSVLTELERAAATDPLWHQTRVALLHLDEQFALQSQAYRGAVQEFNEAVAEFPALLIARLVGLKPLPDLVAALAERSAAEADRGHWL